MWKQNSWNCTTKDCLCTSSFKSAQLPAVDTVSETQTPYCQVMGNPNVAVDVESLQRSDRRRWSCMDVFVIVSIIFLFVAMAVITFVIVTIVMKPREFMEAVVTGDPPSLSYKVEKSSSF